MKTRLFIIIYYYAILIFTGSLHAAIVQPVTSAPEVLIPVAGSVQGANGTFFHSDIMIGNFADHNQTIRLQWLPQGVSSTFSTTIVLGSRSGIRGFDFVHDQLGQSGIGAILVTGVTDTGAFDASAAIYVSSRIWTKQPGTNGNTSQTLPALPTSAIDTTSATIYSLSFENGSDRTNVGIVNLDPAQAQTFQIVFLFSPLPAAFPVTVPPMSMRQVSIVGFGGFDIFIDNSTPAATRSTKWVAYSSVVDNITGDAWSELAVPGGMDINPPGPIGKK